MMEPFYPIVDAAAWLPRLLACGVKLVQLRIKDATPTDLRHAIDAARSACAHWGAQLVVNDHWQLAIDLRCAWVHLGQDDLAHADLAAIRRAGIRLGISTHDHRELDRALRQAPDYVALGPIYPTTLKVMPFGPQGLARITEWKALIGTIPLVAIGGITLERAAGVYAAGADSIAVVSDVLANDDPEARTRAWLRTT